MTEARRELFLAGLVLVLPTAVVAWAARVARAQAQVYGRTRLRRAGASG